MNAWELCSQDGGSNLRADTTSSRGSRRARMSKKYETFGARLETTLDMIQPGKLGRLIDEARFSFPVAIPEF